MKRFGSLLLIILGIVTIVSCEKEFTVEPTEVSLFAETTSKFKVTGSNISYTSLDNYYASVSDDGLITGKKVGETSIIVSSGNQSKEVKVTVCPAFEYKDQFLRYLQERYYHNGGLNGRELFATHSKDYIEYE